MDLLPLLPPLEGHLALLGKALVTLLDLLQAEGGLVATTWQGDRRDGGASKHEMERAKGRVSGARRVHWTRRTHFRDPQGRNESQTT
jgi:hypothetical protein